MAQQRQIKLAKCPTTLALQENPEGLGVTNLIFLRVGAIAIAMNSLTEDGLREVATRDSRETSKAAKHSAAVSLVP